MAPLLAGMLMFAGGPLTRSEIIWFSVIAAAVILEGICQQTIKELVERRRGRNWPTVSAVVDIVSVAFMEDDSLLPAQKAGSDHPYYLATLTYIWHNPELQMGEYRRRFGNEEDARAWANSYKGETLKIHVDPRDPTRSVLRKEDL